MNKEDIQKRKSLNVRGNHREYYMNYTLENTKYQGWFMLDEMEKWDEVSVGSKTILGRIRHGRIKKYKDFWDLATRPTAHPNKIHYKTKPTLTPKIKEGEIDIHKLWFTSLHHHNEHEHNEKEHENERSKPNSHGCEVHSRV